MRFGNRLEMEGRQTRRGNRWEIRNERGQLGQLGVRIIPMGCACPFGVRSVESAPRYLSFDANEQSQELPAKQSTHHPKQSEPA